MKKVVSFLLLCVFVTSILAACSSFRDSQSISQQPSSAPADPVESFSPATASPTSTPVASIVSNEAESSPSESMTTGQRNALASADTYLRFMNFSYSGLVKQLEFEGFTTEEATFAADHCGADWMEQAKGSALSYLNVSAFSYTGLIDQLEFEGYTTEEATYGADQCGADWMEQAAKSAKSYLSFSSFSRSGLIDQLEFEGFTHEQAVYGAEQNGY